MHTSSRLLRFCALAALTGFATSSTARAQCVDWTPGYNLAGIAGSVHAVAVFDAGTGNGREVYAAGQFVTAGDVHATNIAKWNGTRWAPVGVGRPARVHSLCVWDDGTGPALYAGLAMNQGYVPPTGALTMVAKWDGATWTGLPGGVDLGNGIVKTMTVHDDGSGPALYIGGYFHPNQPVWPQANNVARFDGTSWSPVGNGIYNSNQGVSALYSFDDGNGALLFAGGSYLRVVPGAVYAPIARYDGAQWQLFASGVSQPYCEVNAFARFGPGGGSLYAGGYAMFGLSSNQLARLSGSTWSAVGGEIIGTIESMTVVPSIPDERIVASGSLYQGGSTPIRGIGAFDGTNWHGLGGQTSSSMGPVVPYDDGAGSRFVAAGTVIVPGAPDGTSIARYDGSAWSALGPGLDAYPALPTRLASFDDGQGPALYGAADAGVMRRVGDQWVLVGPPNRPAAVVHVHDDGVNGPRLYAGFGATNTSGLSIAQVGRWDGTSWTFLGSGLRFVNTGWYPRIYDMASFDDGTVKRLVVSGDFDLADGQLSPFVAAWDGQAWTTMGPGLNHIVQDVEVYDHGTGPTLFAAGAFSMPGGTHGIARWDGAQWISAGAGAPQSQALHVHDFGDGPRLYASRRLGALGVTAGIDVFDGSTWSVHTNGMSPYSFASYDDGSGAGPMLVVSGVGAIPNQPSAGIVRYDGTQWIAVGTGLQSAHAHELAVHDDGNGPALFALGSFTTSGPYPAYGFARFGPTGLAGCVSTTGTTICAGDGGGAACPCGNTGASGHGCGNSANAMGAQLVAEGQAHRSADNITLRASGMTPGGAALFFQGTQSVASGAGAPFGDGVRCASGALVRLAIRPVSGGFAAFGEDVVGDPAVSSSGQLPIGPSTRIYQVWYRDAQSFCTASTFNLSNGLRILWAP